MASVTVSPRRSASCFAFVHSSSGTRIERGGVCVAFMSATVVVSIHDVNDLLTFPLDLLAFPFTTC